MRSDVQFGQATHSQPFGQRFWTFFKNAYLIWHERQSLTVLDEAQLRDIGITRREATHEAQRAPWDLPNRFMY